MYNASSISLSCFQWCEEIVHGTKEVERILAWRVSQGGARTSLSGLKTDGWGQSSINSNRRPGEIGRVRGHAVSDFPSAGVERDGRGRSGWAEVRTGQGEVALEQHLGLFPRGLLYLLYPLF